MNLGYGFDGTGTLLKEFQFVSTTLTGLKKAGTPGNRFHDSWLSSLPVPLPKQYVLGFDSQKKDLEDFGQKSYLCGERKDGGWWYYYLYGLLVKVPCGTWGLFVLVILSQFASRDRHVPFREELVLLNQAVVLLTVVSSQTEFNIHLRYVFPSLGLAMIFLGQAGHCLTRHFSLSSSITTGLIGYSLLSALLIYPHHLAYFNDFVGGPQCGHRHLLGSSFDWDQDWLLVGERLSHSNRDVVDLIKHRRRSFYDPTLIIPSLAARDPIQCPVGGSVRHVSIYSREMIADVTMKPNVASNTQRMSTAAVVERIGTLCIVYSATAFFEKNVSD